LKKYKIHLVDSGDKKETDLAVRKEQSNYKFKEINGIQLDEPIDDFNHFWDSLRMAALSNRI